jgi:O-glycosyl hydrolase
VNITAAGNCPQFETTADWLRWRANQVGPFGLDYISPVQMRRIADELDAVELRRVADILDAS